MKWALWTFLCDRNELLWMKVLVFLSLVGSREQMNIVTKPEVGHLKLYLPTVGSKSLAFFAPNGDEGQIIRYIHGGVDKSLKDRGI